MDLRLDWTHTMLMAVSDGALAAMLTGVATICVATVGAIAALGARASARRTEGTTAAIDDAVNQRHLTNSPRLFDLVRMTAESQAATAEQVSTVSTEIAALTGLFKSYVHENLRAHKALDKKVDQQAALLSQHTEWEQNTKYPEIEAAIRTALRSEESR